MAKLWLTYAWKDNADQDIDHVISELQDVGLEVNYDRAELLVGQRLWQQIDAAMNDHSVDAWAIFVTENSLASEPCQEEIAYALDRALLSGRDGFPLIGIFPSPIDRSIIPSAIATRLYVDLTTSNWKQLVLEGVTKSKNDVTAKPAPYGYDIHDFNGGKVLEVWPRSGRWVPFVATVLIDDAKLLTNVMSGPRGHITEAGMTIGYECQENEEGYRVIIQNPVDANNSAHIFLSGMPRAIQFGQLGGPAYELRANNSGSK